MKTVKDADKGQSLLPDTSKADHREETMSLPDQICKAEALWAQKTAKDDFSFHASDGFPQLLQRMCPDSEIANSVKMSYTKVSYVIGHGLGLYFLQKTVDDILNTPRTYFTLHFDETTSKIKKLLDILVRYYSENHNEVRVRFLKAAVFGHAYAESVANELCETLQKFSLSLKYLLSLASDGPNVNKAIKTIISKLKQIIRESWLIQDLVNYMWYTIVSGKELRDIVKMWKICILIFTTLSCHHQGGKIMQMYSKN